MPWKKFRPHTIYYCLLNREEEEGLFVGGLHLGRVKLTFRNEDSNFSPVIIMFYASP